MAVGVLTCTDFTRSGCSVGLRGVATLQQSPEAEYAHEESGDSRGDGIYW